MTRRRRTHPQDRGIFERGVGERDPFVHGGRGDGPGERCPERDRVDDGNRFVRIWGLAEHGAEFGADVIWRGRA